MKRINSLLIAAVFTAISAGHSSADTMQKHSSPEGQMNSGAMWPGQSNMQPNMMQMMTNMMPMMMRMHQHIDKHGAMRNGSMMDRDMMRMMMGPKGMRRGMMGSGMTPERMHNASRSLTLDQLDKFDANKDGTLSIQEFELLHTAAIREIMVDRFQHLDADGDGAITKDEATAPASRMNMSGAGGVMQNMMQDNQSDGN